MALTLLHVLQVLLSLIFTITLTTPYLQIRTLRLKEAICPMILNSNGRSQDFNLSLSDSNGCLCNHYITASRHSKLKVLVITMIFVLLRTFMIMTQKVVSCCCMKRFEIYDWSSQLTVLYLMLHFHLKILYWILDNTHAFGSYWFAKYFLHDKFRNE